MRVHLRTVILAAVALGPVASQAAIIGRDNASSNACLATDGNGANDTDPTNNTNGSVSGDDGFVIGAAAFQPWTLTNSGVSSGFGPGESVPSKCPIPKLIETAVVLLITSSCRP